MTGVLTVLTSMWLWGLSFCWRCIFLAYFSYSALVLWWSVLLFLEADFMLYFVYQDLLSFVIYFCFSVSEKLMKCCYRCFICISNMLLVMWKKESHDNTSWIQCNNIPVNEINQSIQNKIERQRKGNNYNITIKLYLICIQWKRRNFPLNF
jgi:hypothetical protein